MPVSEAQRLAIVSYVNEGLSNQQVASHVGVSLGTVAAVKAHMTMGSYREADDAEIVGDGSAEEAPVAFGLERDLQLSLRRNIEQLEPGLTIIDGDREQTVASGRIDITARDKDGVVVVIELKAGSADREAVGQILAYMGDLMEQSARVRGILIAREFLSRAVSAARATPNLRLAEYRVRFNFETVAGLPG